MKYRKKFTKKGIMNNQSALNKIGSIVPKELEFPADMNKPFRKFNLDKEEQANDKKTSVELTIKFRDEIKTLEDSIRNLISKIEFMQNKITQREQEIKRISSNYSVVLSVENISRLYFKFNFTNWKIWYQTIHEIYSYILGNSLKIKSLRNVIYQRNESENVFENLFKLGKHKNLILFR